ncbi:hypothetical protein [Paenibacillus sp. y28]|uniref:hypothetical protein n=1 Tax=Paenibacillus sp. y28 TaxID=3129110 RepID=UPI0030172D25
MNLPLRTGRRIRWRRRWLPAVALLVLWLAPLMTAANGGPLYYPADGAGALQFDTDSPVRLIREHVTFTMPDHSQASRHDAQVEVRYTLQHTGREPETAEVMFVTPSSRELRVQSGSDSIPAAIVSDLQLANWEPQVKRTVTEPVSGTEQLFLGDGWQDGRLVGAKFTLRFEPEEMKQITIQYEDAGGMYDRRVINPVFSHLYYMTPAQYWKGEPQVQLEVRLPQPGYALSSNLPLTPSGAGSYAAQLDRLPETEWYFSYADTKRLFVPINLQTVHNSAVLGVAFVLLALLAGLTLYFRREWIFAAGIVGVFAFVAYFITNIGGYPFRGIFVGFVDTAVAAVLLAGYLIIRKRVRR